MTSIKRHQIVLEKVQNDLKKVLELTKSDKANYREVLRAFNLYTGLCSYLCYSEEYECMILALDPIYWIKKHEKEDGYMCYPNWVGRKYVQRRYEIVSKELKLIKMFGWFARFIPPSWYLSKFTDDN